MSRKLITFDQVLLKLPKNKVIQTSELLGEFPGMKMPALTAQLMRLTSKDLVEKLGASTYRVADNRPYYRVSKYIILPLDLFELIVSYLREGITFQNIHVITGIPMESVKFVNKTLGGKITPRIETKSSIEQARAKLNSATKEELDEIEVEEVEGLRCVLVGLGLNISQPSGEVSDIATSLEVLGQGAFPNDLVTQSLSRELLIGHRWFLRDGGLQEILKRWQERSCFIRGKTELRIEVGDSTMCGVYTGVSETGALLMMVDGAERTIHSGHIVEAKV